MLDDMSFSLILQLISCVFSWSSVNCLMILCFGSECAEALDDLKLRRLAAVEYLLQMGANPEIPDESSCTSLHHAAMKGHKDVISLLLSKGINVDVTSELGSPLQYAASLDLHDTVKVLLDHGANPNLSFPHEYTPLQLAIDSRSWQCLVSLLKMYIMVMVMVFSPYMAI
ncbi:hypothetical protein MKX03_007333 [Papaver bracteatum]|nr:hypothetical protein MKX03_007333 [Papaver bracteatum]